MVDDRKLIPVCRNYNDPYQLGFMEENRVLVFHETTEEEKYAICEWKYDDEYAIYNSTPYEEQVAAKRGFANSKNSQVQICV